MWKNKKNGIVVMNFSGIYRKEQFCKEEICWIDVQDISGTNCYCDGGAFELLLHRIEKFPAGGIHFIDSGNYHYMSRIWLSRIKEPVTLVVFDNHTDMQIPAFGGLLSCGGWISSALEEEENLKDVILIGPDEEAFSQVETNYREKVKFLSREKLREMKEAEKKKFIRACINSDTIPLFLSIDKDILCPGEADTSWSQGDMKLEELISLLKTVLDCAKAVGRQICNVDICGESEAGKNGNREENIRANKVILDFLKNSEE